MIHHHPSRCLFLLFLLTYLLASGCVGQAQEEPATPPNIVWIVSEDNSKHYMALFDENGTATPNIERLAKRGITFTRAFSNGPVCSVARSTLISGCYAPRIGAQYHRKIAQVPMPPMVEMFPAYLRKAGYYTTNNAKEDYNQITSEGVWDESSKKATWRNRAEGQPFFHVHNIGTTHESRLFFTEEEMEETLATNPEITFANHPYHPDTRLFTYTNLRYRNKIQRMDEQLGEVVAKLEEDGLLDNTFIFYYGDHGGVLPGSKGYLKEIGLHVPLVLYVPPAYQDLGPLQPGSESDAFVSFIDFGPTVLHMAGVAVPEDMDGKPFWGKDISAQDLDAKDVTFGYADRFDEKYDLVRSVRKGQYKYIRNFQPYHQDALWNNYRYKQLGYQEWLRLYQAGELNEVQASFFEPKQAEELYDLSTDPFETKNLAADPAHQKTLLDLRRTLKEWMTGMPDLSLYPEYALIEEGAMENPVAFGTDHQKAIERYLMTADLMLKDFGKVSKQVAKSLSSEDPIERYWGLVVCLSAGEQAKALLPQVQQMATKDANLVNRVHAAAYLGLINVEDPVPMILQELYRSQDGTEALLLLNEIVWLQDVHGFSFTIEADKLNPVVQEDIQVERRLAYLAL